MPLYEYQCETCGCCFEQLVFESDQAEIVCPDCHAAKVKKLMSCTSTMGGDGTQSCAPGAPSGFS